MKERRGALSYVQPRRINSLVNAEEWITSSVFLSARKGKHMIMVLLQAGKGSGELCTEKEGISNLMSNGTQFFLTDERKQLTIVRFQAGKGITLSCIQTNGIDLFINTDKWITKSVLHCFSRGRENKECR